MSESFVFPGQCTNDVRRELTTYYLTYNTDSYGDCNYEYFSDCEARCMQDPLCAHLFFDYNAGCCTLYGVHEEFQIEYRTYPGGNYVYKQYQCGKVNS